MLSQWTTLLYADATGVVMIPCNAYDFVDGLHACAYNSSKYMNEQSQTDA